MSEERAYTIGELARRAGVTTRTIRYYAAEGLLPAPGARGRYAVYTDEHLRRLEQIAHLKAQYLPLRAIRERLAAGAVAPPALDARAPFTLGQRSAERPQATGGPSMLAGDLAGDSHPFQMGRYQFFPYTAEPAEAPEQEPLGPAERWQRIVIARGVELHVREPLDAERRERLAALIAAARDQLADD